MIGLAALVLMSLLVCGPAAAFDPFGEATIDPRPGSRVPLDLAFRDENGAVVTLRDVGKGLPIVLAPVLHDCPNICGVTLSGLAQAIEAQDLVPGRDFAVVAFGIDPHEGPAEAAASLDALAAAFPGMPADAVHGLTGTESNVAAVADALGYRYAFDKRIGQYAHVAAVAVLSADGRLARWLYGLAPAPTDLGLALVEAGRGETGGWADQLLLLCYRYDPVTGRYRSVAATMLRVGGGLTVTVGTALIGLAVLRERRKRGGRA